MKAKPVKRKCLWCGKTIKKKAKVNFILYCSPQHRAEHVKTLPKCALWNLCEKRAAGVLDDKDKHKYLLCNEHHMLFDVLGKREFERRFGFLLFKEEEKAKK